MKRFIEEVGRTQNILLLAQLDEYFEENLRKFGNSCENSLTKLFVQFHLVGMTRCNCAPIKCTRCQQTNFVRSNQLLP